MPKLVINSATNDENLPPNLSVGSFDPQESGVETEGDMVRRIYAEAGPGEYNIFCSFRGEARWRRLWSGWIRVEDEEYLLYQADHNVLAQFTAVSTPEKPRTGVLKRVRRPNVSGRNSR